MKEYTWVVERVELVYVKGLHPDPMLGVAYKIYITKYELDKADKKIGDEVIYTDADNIIQENFSQEGYIEQQRMITSDVVNGTRKHMLSVSRIYEKGEDDW